MRGATAKFKRRAAEFCCVRVVEDLCIICMLGGTFPSYLIKHILPL